MQRMAHFDIVNFTVTMTAPDMRFSLSAEPPTRHNTRPIDTHIPREVGRLFGPEGRCIITFPGIVRSGNAY